MPHLIVTQFSGEIPRLSRKKLPLKQAAIARNCDFRHGNLTPSKAAEPTAITVGAGTQSLARYNKEANNGEGFWFQFDADVDVVRSPLADDDYLRTYFTGLDKPRITYSDIATQGGGPYPANSFDLGVSAPTVAPDLSQLLPSTVPEGAQVLSVNYVYTYVTALGEEGPPSPPCAFNVDRWDSDDTSGRVSVMSLATPGGSENIAYKRLYRTELGGTYQRVTTLAVTTTSYVDSIKSDALGAPIPSIEWDKPSIKMKGLTAMPNGVLAGFYDNTVCFSEPLYPHAWPVRYRLALDWDVVGLVMTRFGLIVATTGKPYILSGGHPESLSLDVIETNEPCVAKRGIVDMGDFGMYPSANGLVAVGGNGAPLISEPFMTPEQWRALNPSSFHAYCYNNRYVAFYDNGTPGSFTFHPQEGVTFFDQSADAAYSDIEDGALFIKSGTLLHKWQGSITPDVATWQSGTQVKPDSEFYKCAKVDADSYPVTLSIYADGVLLHSQSVTSRRGFRIPAQRYREFYFVVLASTTVHSVQLASSMAELV